MDNVAEAVVVCVVVAAGIGMVAVGDAVGTVLGVVVGRTSAASADNVDGDDNDQEQHGAGDYDHIESDTDASVGLPCRSSGPQRHDGKDKSGDGAGQTDERCAAVDKRDDGEHESGYRHSRVILLRRRLISGRHRCPLVLHIGRLARHHDGGAGVIYRRASGIQFHHSRRRAAWPAQGSESEGAGIRLRDTFGG